MTFQNFLCWKPEIVHEVINPDAEAVPEEIFLAIHTDYPLLISDQGSALMTMSAYNFLHQHFLDESRGDYVQTMVLGKSGSGKSHFIQWMRLNIPKSDDTYIFSIPKARTSLRTIVERIVELLPIDLAEPYREELKHSDPITLNERGKIDKLLDSLALAISQDQSSNIDEEELEIYLIENIPNIFRDPYLRQSYFTINNPLINGLVNHVFSNSSVNIRAESRREFSAVDIHLGGRNYADAAAPTQEVLDVIGDGQGSPAFDLALKIINRNLDKALTLTLSLTPQRLIGMMTDLRKHLYAQGKRLILLVEDLALLQGIDNALLLALTTAGRQGSERLCELRWAAAVTTGYYDRLEDSARTRLTFRIEMDRPGSESKNLIGRTGLAKFAARYLNAVRVGPEKLQDWHNRLQPHENATPPNACDNCAHRTICHEGFGAFEGYGLYPFNKEALWNMARRADNNLEQCFIPRRFLTTVLRRTLHGHAESLAIGQFPPAVLLDEIGGYSIFSTEDRQNLASLDPINHGRRRTLIELWYGQGRIDNLHPALHQAFGLPQLHNVELPSPLVNKSPVPPQPPRGLGDQPPPNPDRVYLDRWAQGGEMPETMASKLRQALFDTFWDYIDWDALKIDRSSVAGRTGAKPFAQVSFRFRQQTTTPNIPPVNILLPLEDDRSDFERTTIALGGLLHFRNLGHWDFPKGDIALANLLECLQDWSKRIIEQLNALPKYQQDWDPGQAAVELLAIGRLLTGTKPEDINPNTIISLELLPQVSMKSRELDNLVSRLSNDQKSLQRLVQAIYSGKKGGQKGRFIDPEHILKVIKKLRRSKWELLQSPPARSPNPFGTITDSYNRIKNDLNKAVYAEVEARKKWYIEVTAHLSPDENAKEISEKITAARNAMIKLGIPGSNIDDFDNIQRGLRNARLDHLLTANTFTENYEGNEVLSKFASSRKDSMDKVDVFMREAHKMITRGEQGLASRRTEYGSAIQPLTEVQTRIKLMLSSLSTTLEVF